MEKKWWERSNFLFFKWSLCLLFLKRNHSLVQTHARRSLSLVQHFMDRLHSGCQGWKKNAKTVSGEILLFFFSLLLVFVFVFFILLFFVCVLFLNPRFLYVIFLFLYWGPWCLVFFLIFFSGFFVGVSKKEIHSLLNSSSYSYHRPLLFPIPTHFFVPTP